MPASTRRGAAVTVSVDAASRWHRDRHGAATRVRDEPGRWTCPASGAGLVGLAERIRLVGGIAPQWTGQRGRLAAAGRVPWLERDRRACRSRAVITVLLVDDEALVRAGLRMILESADDLSVIGEAEDGHAARRRRPPRPARCGAHGHPDAPAGRARRDRGDPGASTNPPAVVVLTTFDTDDYVFRALEAGATGFLLKDTPPTDLLRAVRLAAAGDSMLSPTVTRQVINRFTAEDRSQRRREALARLAALTEREREVLVEIGLGHANADIARRPVPERGDSEDPRLAPVRQARRDQPGAAGHRRVPGRPRRLTVRPAWSSRPLRTAAAGPGPGVRRVLAGERRPRPAPAGGTCRP